MLHPDIAESKRVDAALLFLAAKPRGAFVVVVSLKGTTGMCVANSRVTLGKQWVLRQFVVVHEVVDVAIGPFQNRVHAEPRTRSFNRWQTFSVIRLVCAKTRNPSRVH